MNRDHERFTKRQCANFGDTVQENEPCNYGAQHSAAYYEVMHVSIVWRNSRSEYGLPMIAVTPLSK